MKSCDIDYWAIGSKIMVFDSHSHQKRVNWDVCQSSRGKILSIALKQFKACKSCAIYIICRLLNPPISHYEISAVGTFFFF